MNKESENLFLKDLREEIDAYIEGARSMGYEVSPGLWIAMSRKQCCPLGACAVANGYIGATDYFRIPKILSISIDEMYSFADGFDGQYYDENKHSMTFFSLGKEYRKKLGFNNAP